MVKNLPANAGDTGSIPGPGRSHVPRNNQVREPQLRARLEPVLRNKRSHHNEKPEHRGKEQPPLASTREKPKCSNKDPVQPKIK